MRILSYNVNGIRSAMSKGLLSFVEAGNFDIVCIQETKAQPEQIDLERWRALGYAHIYLHSAEKKGYSGVGIFSKIEPQNVVVGMGMNRYDIEGRVLRADFAEFTLLNCYFPSGTSGEERQAVKFDFLKDMTDFLENLTKEKPRCILVGDYNIAHTDMDIHSPKTNQKTSGFLPEERAWLTELYTKGGFVDAFRHKNPDKIEYSWWSTRFDSRAQNKGWRIDYQALTTPLATNIAECHQLTDVVHSDHCPVFLELSF
jgi:exodeoxyribonuclease III